MASPIRMTGLTSGLDTESIVKALTSNYSSKVEKFNKEKTKLEWKQDAWKDINSKVYGLYTSLSSLRYSAAYSMRSATCSDATKATVKASGDAPVGTHRLKIKSLSSTQYLTGAKVAKAPDSTDESKLSAKTKLSELVNPDDGTSAFQENTSIKITVEGKETVFNITENTTISDFTSELSKAGLNASFDESNQRFYVSSKESGAAHTFKIEAVADDVNSSNMMKALGMGSFDYVDAQGKVYDDMDKTVEMPDGYGAGKAHVVLASDAEIVLDGETYSGASNTFTVNGLTINAQAVTDNEITVQTSTDVQGLYDKIKDFLTQYNDVMNELSSRYNAESAKGFEPLTEDEKAAMSESQIEKYEDKIKNALLRRDGTLDSVMSTMTRSMFASYEVNGQKYSLTSFGIHTLGILKAEDNEQYAYHIDGDEEDTITGTQKDKLRKALTEDPDGVVDFMKQLVTGLYNNLDVKMKSTEMSSAYTVYNDKQMKKQIQDYNKLIKQWETKVEDMEDYYYHKFSKMESALSTLNSNSSAITGMLPSR